MNVRAPRACCSPHCPRLLASKKEKKTCAKTCWRDIQSETSINAKIPEKRILSAVAAASQQQVRTAVGVSPQHQLMQNGRSRENSCHTFFFSFLYTNKRHASRVPPASLRLSSRPPRRPPVTRPKFPSTSLSAQLFLFPHFEFERLRCHAREIAFDS